MSGCSSKLAYVNLRVGRKEVEKLKKFYTGVGMKNQKLDKKEGAYEVEQFEWAKSAQSCGIQYFFNDDVEGKYSASRSDVYWKIGFGVHDAHAAAEKMSQVTKQPPVKPNQFLDVGYLAHVGDPAGYTVELLQTTFEDNEEKRKALYKRSGAGSGEGNLGNGLNEDPTIGQITTRTGDIDASLQFYTETLGMKLLCVEPVTQYGFDLYFLAFTDETPPNPKDLKAVKNREWTYQRPYTTLEIQVSANKSSKPSPGPEEQAGFDSMTVFADDKLWSSLATMENATKQGDDAYVIRDPDGIKILVRKAAQLASKKAGYPATRS